MELIELNLKYIHKKVKRPLTEDSLPKYLSIRKYYLCSTSAPASSNCFFNASASALAKPSFKLLGAPSTRSLASFKPRPVNSFTNLTIANLLAPAAF